MSINLPRLQTLKITQDARENGQLTRWIISLLNELPPAILIPRKDENGNQIDVGLTAEQQNYILAKAANPAGVATLATMLQNLLAGCWGLVFTKEVTLTRPAADQSGAQQQIDPDTGEGMVDENGDPVLETVLEEYQEMQVKTVNAVLSEFESGGAAELQLREFFSTYGPEMIDQLSSLGV